MINSKIQMRFFKKITIPAEENSCHLWTGAFNGYGRFNFGGVIEYAHRVAWAIANERWPNKFICHSCDNPRCVNPKHLFEASNYENARDAAIKGRMGRPHKLT